ncbi:cytosine methyltransferase [Adhaeribacter arboris]|uniref:Cytosine methyltransferase n=1 Tax=Adhaeribacter arboris TaxID=2072846 RepID=A0A2T2YH12_9BACT|nr:endonuclease domain-containing protein [Adhaeribacter arboris]PSR54805.1 cytosine methyltransferase [Adhaeribacter arboris]
MQERIHNQQNLKNLRQQNRSNLTPAEAELWKHLKNSQIGRKFRRQHSVGNYILDFYCPQEKLAIELDGRDHFTENGYERDEDRTKFLKNLHIKVLRFENKEVFEQLEGVLAEITAQFTTPNPS